MEKEKINIENLIIRLQTGTIASSGSQCKASSIRMKDRISGKNVDIKVSSLRLYRAQTKSAGARCRSIHEMTEPGLGQKMLPVIVGTGERFKGSSKDNKLTAVIGQRLMSASTRSSRARLENHRILLYPERVLLCNNVDRIAAYQENGSLLRQKDMSTREKWFN